MLPFQVLRSRFQWRDKEIIIYFFYSQHRNLVLETPNGNKTIHTGVFRLGFRLVSDWFPTGFRLASNSLTDGLTDGLRWPLTASGAIGQPRHPPTASNGLHQTPTAPDRLTDGLTDGLREPPTTSGALRQPQTNSRMVSRRLPRDPHTPRQTHGLAHGAFVAPLQ